MTMNVYEIVTEKIISLLQSGVVPWRRPWTSTGLPRNLVSKRPYRGVNYFLLSASKYVSPFWLTFRQANELADNQTSYFVKRFVCLSPPRRQP